MSYVRFGICCKIRHAKIIRSATETIYIRTSISNYFERYIVIIFFSICLNICFRCSYIGH